MTAAVAEVQQRRFEQFEAYQQWETQQLSDPRFASVRMLMEDMQHHGNVLPQTWERFDVEERTWAAEVLNAPHSHIDRFVFDGQDIIVKESDGVNPRLTLGEVYQNGLDKTREDVVNDPGLAFQLERDELFMRFYEEIKRMMRGEIQHDTIHMVSACPDPNEFSNISIDEATRLLNSRFYDLKQRKSFDYTARRLPDGRLELSATRLDAGNLDAHAAVLRASGHEEASFRMLQSHSYGKLLSYDTTTGSPIQVVIAARAAIYDAELEAQTGQKHYYGRTEESIDAHEFFRDHCDGYWAGYKAFNEQLAMHFAGGELQRQLQKYLLSCLEKQEQVGRSVLMADKIDRLRVQLWHKQITPDMAMSCRELLIYDHHATLTRLHKQFLATGQINDLSYAGSSDFMDAYAQAASDNGSVAAANGETFAGCETATSVSSLTSAAQTANERHISLEQALREREEEAMHCLRIQLYGFTIRRGVHCPFCAQKVDARDTAKSIECLNDKCRTVLDKASGEVTSRLPEEHDEVSASTETPAQQIKLRVDQDYTVGGATYHRHMLTVVGGAHVMYTDEAGQRISGIAAERLDAIISQQISAETQAA